VQILAASAWTAHAQGKHEQALKLMRAAANLEDGSEKHVAMENRLYPMRELLGDMLLEMKRPAEALTAYEAAMQATPNRLRGLYGAATAAEMAKDEQKAKAYYGKLVVLTQNADTVRPEVQQAKLYLSRR
jgi:tetratricopeptide (TPR) repeat protein